MAIVAGVCFRHQRKMFYYQPTDLIVMRGDKVVVATEQGEEVAEVIMPATEIPDDKLPKEILPILRFVDDDDLDQIELNEKNEKDAIRICREKIVNRNLQMKLIKAEYTFDRSKLTFYFTAEGRVDFRELVKDLASVFRTRIELRQIGVRDETRILGGVGSCGRPLCCATWLSDFVPVSIKMAKEQNLSLNSAKISGVCGRLMCCLKNEQESYEYLNSKLPDLGSSVKTKDGFTGQVQSVNVLLQKVTVVINEGKDEKEARIYSPEDLIFQKRAKSEQKNAESDTAAEKED